MKKQVYYINDNLEIKKGYMSAKLQLKSDLEVTVEYKGIKRRVSAENIADDKDKLNIQLNKLRVLRFAKDRMLKPKWINDVLHIGCTITTDVWECELNEYGEVNVWHKNSNQEKFKFHFQETQPNFFMAVERIANHDFYEYIKNERNKFEEAFYLVSTNTAPRWCIS